MSQVPDSALIGRHRRRSRIVAGLQVVEAVVYYGAAAAAGAVFGAALTISSLSSR